MSAGNWTTGAGIGDANQSLITKSIEVALHESAKNSAIIASPVMQAVLQRDEGLGQLFGALGLSVGLAAIGQGKMAATAEGTEANATNYSLSSVTVTPARREYVRKVSDFARSMNESLLTGDLAPDVVATMIFEGMRTWENTLVDLVVALASSATYSSGTTSQAYTWQALHNLSIDMADRGDYGPVHLLLSAKGTKDLSADAMSLGGAVSMAQQVQQFLNVAPSASGAAFIGNFLGRFSLYMCSELDTDGSDTLGIAFSANGVQTKHQMVPLPAEAVRLIDAGVFTIEARRPGGGLSTFSVVSHNAAGVYQQGGLAKIVYATS